MPTRTNAGSRGRTARWLAGAIGAGCILAGSAMAARTFGEWQEPVRLGDEGSDPEVNTRFNDGCPILSPDGLSLYMATNRPGGLGGQDIWVARRNSTRSAWGPPAPLPAPVNSDKDDFCPTPVIGKGLFFVSKRTKPDGDIYFTRLGEGGWQQPIHLGPNINSDQEEWSPSFFFDRRGNAVLYFSRNPFVPPPGTPVNAHDIYYSVNFGPAQLAPLPGNGPGSPTNSDARPNVRRDGLEMVWDSNRQPGGLGAQDVWAASRSSSDQPWGEPRPLTVVNSPMNESRASLSWDGTFLLFGSFRQPNEGAGADIWVTSRERVRSGEEGDED